MDDTFTFSKSIPLNENLDLGTETKIGTCSTGNQFVTYIKGGSSKLNSIYGRSGIRDQSRQYLELEKYNFHKFDRIICLQDSSSWVVLDSN